MDGFWLFAGLTFGSYPRLDTQLALKFDLGLPKHPSQAVKKYELGRIKCVKENKAKFDELGLGKYGTDRNPPTVQKQKGKDKVVYDDEYVLESEHESDDSSKEMKRIPAGPRTRSPTSF
ncbi:hypothetical protein OROMI_032236 [Orobanche minor]